MKQQIFMNEYFKTKTECFLYLKALYTFAEEYGEEYGDILSLDDYDINKIMEFIL